MKTREITYAEAIREAFGIALERDPRVLLVGLGVPDPKGFFGTTLGLQERFGADRVMDMPCAENGMTGIAVGAALNGLRPVINHQRLDFSLLAMDPMCTQAAKWHYMFGGAAKVPMVMRMIVGRGWGQGPQHSQALHSWFAHIPGLKVVMPTTPADAKGLLAAAIEDDNPVVYIEHRWLHHIKGEVPEGHYSVPIGPARIARQGADITIAAVSYMVLEALQAADSLARAGISAEVIDVRSLRPYDRDTLSASAAKTGRLLVADAAWSFASVSSEIVAAVAEDAFTALKAPPRRICLPDCPTPTSPALAADYYPRAGHIAAAARAMLDAEPCEDDLLVPAGVELDKPNPAFTGPF